MIKSIILAFIPIYVAVDAIGVLPIYIGLTQDLNKKQQNRIIVQSLITALTLALGFILLGKLVFKFLGITIADFMVAGGIILFCIAITDLLSNEKFRRMPSEDMGAVPIGTPLIVGPAVLTTTLMLVDQYGIAATIVAVIANVLLAGIVFLFSDVLIRLFGRTGAAALSKVMALLLAAIAVMMIRRGIYQLLQLGM